MNRKVTSIIIVYVLVIILLFIFKNKISDSVLQFLSLAGTFASVFGLFVVWLQMLETKSAALASKDAAEKARDSLNDFLSVMDLTKMIKTIHEIQSYNRHGKYEVSLIRMQELKEGLQQINNNPNYRKYIKPHNYLRFFTDISIDIKNIEKRLTDPNRSLDVIKLNENLDKTLFELNELSSKLRYKGE